MNEPKITQLKNALSQMERLETGSWEKPWLKPVLCLVSVSVLQTFQL